MFLWDYIITFGMEVDLVWKSKWNFMTGLYLLQRYLPFIHLIWVVSRQSDVISYFPCSIVFIGQILTETGCRAVYYVHGGS